MEVKSEKELLLVILDGLKHILEEKTDPINEAAYLVEKIFENRPELVRDELSKPKRN